MGVKSFIARKMIERQMKNLPESQKAMFMSMYERNPALFENIAKEIQEKKKQGQDEMLATMAVMKKYQPEMQKLMTDVQSMS